MCGLVIVGLHNGVVAQTLLNRHTRIKLMVGNYAFYRYQYSSFHNFQDNCLEWEPHFILHEILVFSVWCSLIANLEFQIMIVYEERKNLDTTKKTTNCLNLKCYTKNVHNEHGYPTSINNISQTA